MSLFLAEIWYYVVGSAGSYCNVYEGKNVKKPIKTGITVLKIVIGGSKLLTYDHKLCFMAPLMSCRKTKFPTIKQMIFLL